jgi:hypothetical protein
MIHMPWLMVDALTLCVWHCAPPLQPIPEDLLPKKKEKKKKGDKDGKKKK